MTSHKVVDVTTERLETAHTVEQAITNAKKLVSRSQNISIDKINFERTEYAIPIVFEYTESVLVFGWHENLDQLRITIVNSTDKSEPCLDIRVSEKSGIVMGKIGFVRTRGSSGNVKCSIPKEGAAAWMIRLVDQVYCMLGLEYAFLEDNAQLSCNGTNVNFLLLRIFQGKFSWYESFGYPIYIRSNTHGTIPSTYNRSAYEKDIEYLRSLSVGTLRNLTDSSLVDNLERASPVIRKILQEAGRNAYGVLSDADSDERLDTFLSELWTKSCQDYIAVVAFMMTCARIDVDGKLGSVYPFAPALHRVMYIGAEYLKKLKCS